MSRYIQNLTLNKPNDFVQFIMNDYLTKHGFSMSNWKGEPAYRAGDGMVEGYKYLTWSYSGGVFRLEAWLKGTFGKEMGLDGFVGVVIKKPFKSSLIQLLETLQQPLPQQGETFGQAASVPGGQQAGTANTQAGPAPNVIPVQTMDNHKPAIAALAVGILSIVSSFFIPLIGIILACIGFTLARMGQGSSKASMAGAGKICSIVGICLSAGIWLLNVVLNVLVIAI